MTIDPVVWKSIGAVVGLLISLPAILALVRVAYFVGEMSRTVKGLGDSFDALSTTLTAIQSWTRSEISDHGERLTKAETEIDGLKERERARVHLGAYDRRASAAGGD